MTEEPPKKKKQNGCLIAVAFFLGLAVLGSIVGPDERTEAASTESTAAEAGQAEEATAAIEAIQVTATELVRAYDANEMRAQQTFGDRVLDVTGKVAGIDLGLTNKPTVTLQSDDAFNTVIVRENKAMTAIAADLDKGQTITLRCQGGAAEVMGSPVLKDCALRD